MVQALWMLLLSVVVSGDGERLQQVKAFEFDETRGLATALYKTGEKYYLGGYRKESIHFMKRCLEIRPDNGPIRGLVARLQDFDNPTWRKKKWRSPMGRVASGFDSTAKKFDETYTKALVHFGNNSWKYRDEPDLLEWARGKYLRALDLHGGPFELDRKERLDLGVTQIPSEPTAMLIEEDLVRINGLLYVRDSMLRVLKSVDSVCEARGEHAVVRTVDSKELAERLLPLMEAAWDDYVARSGQELGRPLGLFVFPDQASFRAYCLESGHADQQNTAGFAHSGDGFAVTFAQPLIEQLAVHEGAHLFYFLAFRSIMPSWYEEGLATSFGGEGTMTFEEGKLTTHLPMSPHRISELLDAGAIPLQQLLTGRASVAIDRGVEEGVRFYTQAWALYTFLHETTDKRFRDRFSDWETFALGSGVEATSSGQPGAAALFDRLFQDVMVDLEAALLEWMNSKRE